MMKRIFKTSILSALLAVTATGCIEEVFPSSGFLTSDQLENYSVEMLVNGIAVDMMAAETSGYGDHIDFGIPSIHLKTDYMLADIVSLGNSNYNQFNYYVACLGMGAEYGYGGYFWDSYYSWIKGTNEIISRIDPDTDDPDEKLWLAQAYTYRAMCYLDLARLYIPKQNDYLTVYGNIMDLTVPIVTEDTTVEQAQNNPRVPREEMYNFIIDDLQTAVSLFGTNSDASGWLRPSLAAAYGLLARTYLEISADLYDAGQGYGTACQKAIDYAQLAITTSGRTPLTQAQWEDPVNGFNNGSANNSWIWGLSVEAPSLANVISFTAHISAEATWAYGTRVRPGVNSNMYNRIGAGDFRRHSWLAPSWTVSGYDYQFAGNEQEREAFKASAAPYTSLKFRPAGGEVTNYTVGSCADHPLMRVEEMYFIQMEATARRDRNITAAKTLLESFMNNYRYMEGYTYTCSATTMAAFYEEMLFQKRVEFWGEGVVMYDHKRLDIGFTREGGNFVTTFTYNVTGRSPQWNIVIPRGEIQSNTALEGKNNPDPSGFWMGS